MSRATQESRDPGQVFRGRLRARRCLKLPGFNPILGYLWAVSYLRPRLGLLRQEAQAWPEITELDSGVALFEPSLDTLWGIAGEFQSAWEQRKNITGDQIYWALRFRLPRQVLGFEAGATYLRYTNRRILRISLASYPNALVGHLAKMTPTGGIPPEELFSQTPDVEVYHGFHTLRLRFLREQ